MDSHESRERDDTRHPPPAQQYPPPPYYPPYTPYAAPPPPVALPPAERRGPSPLHYVTIALAICQLIAFLWVGIGRIGTLITDQRDSNALAVKTAGHVEDIDKKVAEIARQVTDVKAQQDQDRKDVSAHFLTVSYDIRDILVALAAQKIFPPSRSGVGTNDPHYPGGGHQ